MKKRGKYLFKNLGILTISKFSSKILIFLLIPLYTNILTTKEYGLYDLIISTIQLIFPILTLNIVDAIMRFSMEKNTKVDECATIGMKYILVSTLLVFIFLLINYFFDPIKQIYGYEILIFLYYLFYSFSEYFSQLAKGMERVKDMGIAGVLGTFFTIIGNLLFLLVFKLGLNGFILANILGLFVQVFYYTLRIKIWKYINFHNYNKKLNKEMLVYCVPLIFTVIGWWINSASDRYAVTFICGLAATGLLSISYKIPSIINTIQSIFTQAWQISAIKEYDSYDSAEFYGTYFENIDLVFSIICSLLIIFSRLLAGILYSKDFYQAWIFVPFLLISSVFNSASGFLGPILSAQKKSKAMAKSAICGTISNVVLNILLIYLIGVQGATIATMVSSFLIYWIRKKEVGKDILINNYSSIVITWCLLIVQATIDVYLSIYPLEIILIIAILFINTERIKKILNSFKLKRSI